MKLIRVKYHLNSIVVLALFLVSWVFFIYIKINIPLTYHESTSQGYILTVATLLFSFLVGHYFNSRYERYISIREYHLSRHSRCISLIDIAQSFSENKILLKKLYEKLNDIAVIDELCSWSEGYIEEPYYRNLYCLLDEIKIIDQKDLTNYRIFYGKINEINELTRKLNSLDRDKF